MVSSSDSALLSSNVFSIEGKVALVTGASSGLGHRFARVLAANGALVVAVARRKDRLDELSREWPNITPLAADLHSDEARRSVVDSTVDRHGRIDVLVNNAGSGDPLKAVDEPLDHFRRVLELNLVAMFDLARLAANPMMAGPGGSVINVASILGMVSPTPIPNASYTASKGAVINLTRDLACQWARKHVRVNALAPGFFPSEAMSGMDSDWGRKYIESGCPMGRVGRPEELDGALLFLASDTSTYCTGSVLTVDGGWTAH